MKRNRKWILLLLGLFILRPTNASKITGDQNMMGYRFPRTDLLKRAFSGCTWSEELNRHRVRDIYANSRPIPRGSADRRYAWIPEWEHDDYADADYCEP